MDKSEAYLRLVSRVKEDYKKNKSNGQIILSWCNIDGYDLCNEINLWTYWQGLGYSKSTPEIDYLLVGQDWGNPFSSKNKALVNRIKAINSGKMETPYIVTDDGKPCQTDINLISLFRTLNIGDEECNISNTRFPNVFFTDFSLGYRLGNETHGMSKDLMSKDGIHFRDLCEILEPKRIICLGKLTFECAYESLNTGLAKNIINYNGSYNDFLEGQDGFPAKLIGDETRIYPVSHCGSIGTLNRNKIYIDGRWIINPELPQNDPLFFQKKDWGKIKL